MSYITLPFEIKYIILSYVYYDVKNNDDEYYKWLQSINPQLSSFCHVNKKCDILYIKNTHDKNTIKLNNNIDYIIDRLINNINNIITKKYQVLGYKALKIIRKLCLILCIKINIFKDNKLYKNKINIIRHNHDDYEFNHSNKLYWYEYNKVKTPIYYVSLK